MKEIYFFDAYARIGPRPETRPGEAWRLSDLLEEMAYCSISGALVASTQSVLYDPAIGNRELSELLEPYSQLFPVWNVAPGGGEGAASALERDLRERAIRAVTLHPVTNGWDWHAAGSRPMLDLLSDRQTLTIIPRAEIESLRDFRLFLEERPLLPVMMAGASGEELPAAVEMLGSHPNLHLGFVGSQPCGWIESLAKAGFAKKLLFATGAPWLAIGPHRAMIDFADLDRETRQQIAGENLVALLEGQLPERVRANRGEDAFMRASRAGKPLSAPVIDIEGSLVDEVNGDPAGPLNQASSRHWFSLHGRVGCRGGGIASWRGTAGLDSSSGHDAIRRILDDGPPGYWGAATIDPVHYAQDEISRIMTSVYDDRRFIALHPCPRLGLPLNDSRYDVWWRFADRHGFVAIVDGAFDISGELPGLAKRFPRIKWVVFPAGHPGIPALAALANEWENVAVSAVFDTFRTGQVERAWEALPPGRFLFAGGAPRVDPRQSLGAVVFSRLSLEAKREILGANAMAFFSPLHQRLPEAIFG